MTDKEIMQMALDALEDLLDDTDPPPILRILRQAIEQAEEQEPVACLYQDPRDDHWYASNGQDFATYRNAKLLYAAPPARPWVGLTDEERDALWSIRAETDRLAALEQILKEKNT